MMISLAVVSAFLRRINAGDILARVAILSTVVTAATLLFRSWPAIVSAAQHALLVSGVRILSALVGPIFLFLIFCFFLGLIIGTRNKQTVQRWAAKTGLSLTVYVVKGIAMTLVNTSLLAGNLVYAAVSVGPAKDRVFDAFTHYLERMTDVVLRPQR